jgi:hypothetical protein
MLYHGRAFYPTNLRASGRPCGGGGGFAPAEAALPWRISLETSYLSTHSRLACGPRAVLLNRTPLVSSSMH